MCKFKQGLGQSWIRCSIEPSTECANSDHKTDFSELHVTVRYAGSVSREETRTMLKVSPHRAIALPIPTPDDHQREVLLGQLLNEADVEYQRYYYPSPTQWREKEYQVNGESRRLG